MTSTNRIYFNYGFYAYQAKARNPGNTLAATNPVFDLLMTSNDLNDLQKWVTRFTQKQFCINKNVIKNPQIK